MKVRRLFTSLLCALAVLTTGAATTSCAAAGAWWQGVLSNPGNATSFISYVLTFLQGVVSIWNAIFPTIPAASQRDAQINFSNVVYSIEQALAALEDAIRAAAAAHEEKPDFSSLVANVQAAVAALVKIVQAWQGPEGSRIAEARDIVRQANVIAAWK